LQAYQRILPILEEMNAAVLALSPQSPSKSKAGAAEARLAFPVLSDRNNKVARSYRLVFQVGERLRDVFLNVAGIDLMAVNEDDSWELPIPGTFIVDSRGVVRLAYVHADYTRRLEPAEILRRLRRLRRETASGDLTATL
jgi:peroxiredoxin